MELIESIKVSHTNAVCFASLCQAKHRQESKGERSTNRPEIVHKQIEQAQQNHKQNSRGLSLESNNNHHASHESNQADQNPPEAPFTREHKAHEQEDQKDTARKLDVHLAVFLVKLRESGGREALADPAVREDHEQAADDREVAEEEVQVEDEAVAEGLGDDDGEEADDGVFGVLADDDEGGAGCHCDDVEEEEEVRDAAGN